MWRMLRKLILAGIVGLLLSNVAITATAAEDSKDFDADKAKEDKGWFDPTLFHDPEDDQFDVSNWLASRHGFMPQPIIITGPTLGAGGGLNLMFLRWRCGIANKRYQGQHVFVGEAQLNWRLYDRWHLIGFIGSGKAYGHNKLKRKVDFSDAGWRTSKGIGFRYELARKFGLQAGVDLAWGPDDTAVYITVGSAWNSFF